MANMNFSGKHGLILGLGESGLATAQWLLRCGAILRVADTRQAPERLAQLRVINPTCDFVSGAFTADLLNDIDFIVASPGLSELNELAEIAPQAIERGLPVWSEIEIFAQSLQYLTQSQQYAPKIIAITGTNGKTTVTSLVGKLVERAGKSVKIAGNISPSVLDVLRIALDTNSLPEVWVLELSSFQLHFTNSLQADAATVLNVTQDHLDWHGTMMAYAADKAKIFAINTVQVLNRDDAIVMQMQRLGATQYSFGLSEPQRANEYGLHHQNGMNWLAFAQPLVDEEGVQKRKTKAQLAALANNQPEIPSQLINLMPADALKIRGNHNAMNALAALALCRAIGLPQAPLLHGLRDYQGEPHRVELIATIAGVDYVDDSKGTNVGATVAAIKGLAQAGKKLFLIAGGVGKGQDFSPLSEVISAHVAELYLIGLAANDIAKALENSGVTMTFCETLEQAVINASKIANAGDMVLLSPACASFDMFAHYAHRAQVFLEAVKEVAHQHGEVVS